MKDVDIDRDRTTETKAGALVGATTLVEGLANKLLPPRESHASHTLRLAQYTDDGKTATTLTYGGKKMIDTSRLTPVGVARAFREAFERLEQQLESPPRPDGGAQRIAVRRSPDA